MQHEVIVKQLFFKTIEIPLYLRFLLYHKKIIAQKALPHPVLSVGSIKMGGSNKTPMTIYLAKLLLEMGETPVILTRGYRRKSSKLIVIENSVPDWREVGDEPAMLTGKLPDVKIAVNRNRYYAGMSLREKATIYILDDGFQHLGLKHDLDILMLDGDESDITIFPFGGRRDTLWRFNYLGQKNPALCIVPKNFKSKRQLECDCKVLHRNIKIGEIKSIKDNSKSINITELHRKKVFLAAGIAKPIRFYKLIEKTGIDIVGYKWFLDHRFDNIEKVKKVSDISKKNHAEIVLVTEKDAVKIRKFAPDNFFALTINLEVIEKEALVKYIQNLLEVYGG